jgi:beta-mannosidase
VANDRAAALEAELEVSLFRAGEIAVGAKKRTIAIAPHAAESFAAASLFEGFLDLSYAYRFGPPTCDLAVATLRAGDLSAQAFHFPVGLPRARELEVGLSAEARAVPEVEGAFTLLVKTRRFAQSIVVEAEGFVADDAWFHLAPGGERTLRLRRVSGTGSLRGTVRALNAETVAKIVTSP